MPSRRKAMSQPPNNLRYLATHQWARKDGNEVIVGITDHAQSELGDVVFVDLPEVGRECLQRQACAVVESVKTASDVQSPMSGTVISVNDNLNNSPELLNTDPYGAGWICKIKPSNPAEWDQLLDADAYSQLV
jgi:glycine cleavage system H protein